MTVFEPKLHIRVRPKTDKIPLGQTASLQLMGINCELKDKTVCLDLTYFQPNYKIEKLLYCYFWIFYPFFNWCSKFFSQTRIQNTFQIRGKMTQRQQYSLKTKLICRFSNKMDRVALFRIIFWRNKIHRGKTSPGVRFSRIQ